jgi:hypothetical protein
MLQKIQCHRNWIAGFFEALRACANAFTRSSALYRSKISRMFKLLQIYAKKGFEEINRDTQKIYKQYGLIITL